MIYTLMHRNEKVIDIDIDEYGKIKKYIKMYNRNHMPYGTIKDFDKVGISKLNDWFVNRTIPSSRDLYKEFSKKYNIDSPTSLPLKSYALSLSDQYWIKEAYDDITWDDINFFDNPFSLDLGDLLVGKNVYNKPINYISPDSSSNGDLMKRWKIINGKRVLLKSGTKPYNYEVFNEVIASSLMDLFDINHVKYCVLEDDNNIYSACDNFILSSKDLVTVYQLFNDNKKENSESYFDFLIRILDGFNIDNYRVELNKMFFIDFLIGNVDRHLNNFGLIRDIKSLKFEAVAPIYDSGSSFGFNINDRQLAEEFYLDWKPFKSNKIETQLDLIDDFNFLDVKKLDEVEKIVNDICLKNNNYISNDRRNSMIKFIRKRVDYIKKYLNVNTTNKEYSQLDLKVLEYIKTNGRIDNIDGLAALFNKSHITIQRSINRLVINNDIERVGANKNGYWKVKD